jgi:hypothetical protein
MRTLIVLIVSVLLTSCAEPLSMIPGGKLSGEVQSSPADWIDVPEIIQVETRPSDPYSINIWGVGIGPDLYFATGDGGTTWSAYVAADNKVRARVNDSLHEFNAINISDPAERKSVEAAYVSKYELDPDDNWVTAGIIFRLDRRTP